jgi:hypothetical protein
VRIVAESIKCHCRFPLVFVFHLPAQSRTMTGKKQRVKENSKFQIMCYNPANARQKTQKEIIKMSQLNSTTLHYTTLHYTTLHYTTLHYTTLHNTTHCNRTKQKKSKNASYIFKKPIDFSVGFFIFISTIVGIKKSPKAISFRYFFGLFLCLL